jgi:hypothetical protein
MHLTSRTVYESSVHCFDLSSACGFLQGSPGSAILEEVIRLPPFPLNLYSSAFDMGRSATPLVSY